MGEAEAIVRALAGRPAPISPSTNRGIRCSLCDAAWGAQADLARDIDDHRPWCNWRQAREWVAAHPEGAGSLAAAAKRLLDNVAPFGSALEVEYDADGEELYGDLAEALGLPRSYRRADDDG